MDVLGKSWTKLFSILLCFIIALASFSLACAEQAGKQKVVRVGWYEDVYNITGKNGERSGYGYEFLQAVAAYTGWKYEYVSGSWSELHDKMKKGEIDIMSGISYTPERTDYMLFSALPMGEEKYYLYADLQHTDISAADLTTLNGKRIGVIEKSAQEPLFYAWEKQHDLKIRHVFVDNYDDSKRKVANGEVDGIISTETKQWIDSGLSAIAVTGSSKIYFALNKNRSDLKAELDMAMRRMEYDKPFYADELYKRYLASESVSVLEGEEKIWLAKHGAIRIGWLKNDFGVSMTDPDSGKLAGIITDYIKFAESCLYHQKLRFELIAFDSQTAEYQALKDGKIDMVFHASQNPYFAENNGLALSNTVMNVTIPVVTSAEFFEEEAANRVAIEKDNLLLKAYVAYNYPQWKIIEYPSWAEAEKAVRNGQADCFIANHGPLRKYLEDEKLHSVFLLHPCNTAFAVKQDNVMLLSILNKTLRAMPSSMLTGALNKYDNPLRRVTVKDFAKDNVLLVLLVFIIIVLLVVLVRQSKAAEAEAKRSAKETLALNDRLKEMAMAAQQANEAKTDFLFNMSHDIRTPMNALLGYSRLMKAKLRDAELLGYQEKMEQAGNLLLSIINNVLDMARIESGNMELDENYSKVGDIPRELCEVFGVEAKKKQIQLTYEEHVEHKHVMCDVTKVRELFSNLISNAIKYTPVGGSVTIVANELPAQKEGYVRIRTDFIDTGIGMSKEYLPKLYDSFSRERNTTAGKVAGTGLGMAIVKKFVDMMGGTIEVASELGKGSRFTVTLEHRIADEVYYTPQMQPADLAAAKEFIKGKRILMAEDNDLNAEIAVHILSGMGLIVERVEDGVQCVSKIEQQPAGTYDLVLMDIQMPNMDGYLATEKIRRLDDVHKAAIPIVAMTANAFEEDKQNALEAGMDGHIAKPIDVAKMEQTLVALLK